MRRVRGLIQIRKFSETREKESPSQNTHGHMFVGLNSPEKTAKKLPHDLRFTVMADCIRIGGKGSEANGKPATRGAVRINFF